MKKTSAEYQREYRKRLREKGLIKKEVWVLPENSRALLQYEKKLRLPLTQDSSHGPEVAMTSPNNWTTQSLYGALNNLEYFSVDATVDIVEGAESSLHITMKEYGDLPIFLTASGDQILVEAILWPEEMISDKAKFNDEVLRTHKLFPLSTISLDGMSDGKAYYTMFGALSATSLLSNIQFEIEVLADNVIKATEAYESFLEQKISA